MTAEATGAQRRSGAQPIDTWFHVGGGCPALLRPPSRAELTRLLAQHPEALTLGAGANLLVDDDGLDHPVICLDAPGEFTRVERDDRHGLLVGAGVNLARLVARTPADGLAGLERLAGVPATIGGAIVMNAGGRHGDIAALVDWVDVLPRDPGAAPLRLTRSEIGFGYRRSGLEGFIVLGARLQLEPADTESLRIALEAILAEKRLTQPLSARSAGCCFKNPTLGEDLASAPGDPPLGLAGQRVAAGLLLDRAGCKNARVGGARISDRHANFVVTNPGATARDVLGLMRAAAIDVRRTWGVMLEREVVIWSRHDAFASRFPAEWPDPRDIPIGAHP